MSDFVARITGFRFSKVVFWCLSCLVLSFLSFSIIRSGYIYMLDGDEIFHVQKAYLLTQGMIPYRDFFMTYTPVFHVLLLPFLWKFGMTFSAVFAMRAVMIALFFLRLFIFLFCIRMLFGNRIMAVAAFLYLIEPFSVFSGMQIRPDNISQFLLGIGIALTLHQWKFRPRTISAFAAGICFGASIIIMLKTFPTIAVFSVFFLWWCWVRKRIPAAIFFVAGCLVPFCGFFLLMSHWGVAGLALQQSVFDAKLMNDSLRYPVEILNFYMPDNAYVYGSMGQPIAWYIATLFPFFSAAGLVVIFLSQTSIPKRTDPAVMTFLGAFVLQWASLLFLTSVFIQYFLPLTWFYAATSAYVFVGIYDRYRHHAVGQFAVPVLGIALFASSAWGSYSANIHRTHFTSGDYILDTEAAWKIIDPSAFVYPGMLFRKTIYPVDCGACILDMPAAVTGRFPNLEKTIRENVRYIVTDDFRAYTDPVTIAYIEKNFRPAVPGSRILVRK